MVASEDAFSKEDLTILPKSTKDDKEEKEGRKAYGNQRNQDREIRGVWSQKFREVKEK